MPAQNRSNRNGRAPQTDAPAQTDAPQSDAPVQVADAPATDAPQSDAPATLAALAATETIVKAQRVFADVAGVPRVPADDGRIVTVQREMRADGSTGPMMLALIRRAPDRSENAVRYPLVDMQVASEALASAGITLI